MASQQADVWIIDDFAELTVIESESKPTGLPPTAPTETIEPWPKTAVREVIEDGDGGS